MASGSDQELAHEIVEALKHPNKKGFNLDLTINLPMLLSAITGICVMLGAWYRMDYTNARQDELIIQLSSNLQKLSEHDQQQQDLLIELRTLLREQREARK